MRRLRSAQLGKSINVAQTTELLELALPELDVELLAGVGGKLDELESLRGELAALQEAEARPRRFVERYRAFARGVVARELGAADDIVRAARREARKEHRLGGERSQAVEALAAGGAGHRPRGRADRACPGRAARAARLRALARGRGGRRRPGARRRAGRARAPRRGPRPPSWATRRPCSPPSSRPPARNWRAPSARWTPRARRSARPARPPGSPTCCSSRSGARGRAARLRPAHPASRAAPARPSCGHGGRGGSCGGGAAAICARQRRGGRTRAARAPRRARARARRGRRPAGRGDRRLGRGPRRVGPRRRCAGARRAVLRATRRLAAEEEQRFARRRELARAARGLGGRAERPPRRSRTPRRRSRPWRDPDQPGAPLWRLCDFAPTLDDAARAGLERALEASGLLDARVDDGGALRSGHLVIEGVPHSTSPR